MQLKYYERNKYTGEFYNKNIEEHALLQWQGELAYIEFPALKRIPGVKHAFSTRLGGVSTGYLSSMNLADNCGDSRENLTENFRRMAGLLGITLDDIVLSDQIHEAKVVAADRSHVMGEELEKKLKGADGLMTDTKGIALASSYADCVPLLFADSVKSVIASVHAGWRGTVKQIGMRAVEAMEEQYGCDRKNIQAVIGPSICQNCFEVGREVVDEFAAAFSLIFADEALKKDALGKIIVKKKDGEDKYLLDLWMANRIFLEKAGLQPEHITTACVCTCCNHELLHSHRATGGKRGGLRAFIMLCPARKEQA